MKNSPVGTAAKDSGASGASQVEGAPKVGKSKVETAKSGGSHVKKLARSCEIFFKYLSNRKVYVPLAVAGSASAMGYWAYNNPCDFERMRDFGVAVIEQFLSRSWELVPSSEIVVAFFREFLGFFAKRIQEQIHLVSFVFQNPHLIEDVIMGTAFRGIAFTVAIAFLVCGLFKEKDKCLWGLCLAAEMGVANFLYQRYPFVGIPPNAEPNLVNDTIPLLTQA